MAAPIVNPYLTPIGGFPNAYAQISYDVSANQCTTQNGVVSPQVYTQIGPDVGNAYSNGYTQICYVTVSIN